MITFLQHTDPLLPHYRAPEFTFPRGALATLDRQLFGDLGSIPAWLGATLTHGISETHVLHHVSSKIPHYNAWEAGDALRQRLQRSGINLDGGAAGWAPMYKVFRECKVKLFRCLFACHVLIVFLLQFVEDEGSVVFYKNAYGLAKVRPVFPDGSASDSGVEVDK
jgi:omega-6 fatty acid desaturase (delta-12 desaturase)